MRLNAIGRRMLEEAGIVEKYAALLNPAKIGLGLTIFARLWLTGQDAGTVDHFTHEIWQIPQVVECHLMAED